MYCYNVFFKKNNYFQIYFDVLVSWSFDSKNWYVKLNNTVDFLEDWQENFMVCVRRVVFTIILKSFFKLAAQRLSPDHDMLKLWVSDDIGASFHSVVFPTELEQQVGYNEKKKLLKMIIFVVVFHFFGSF